MKKILFLSFLLINLGVKSEEINLGRSFINSEYIEIEKLRGTKNVIVIEKKDIESKAYTNLEAILEEIPSIKVGTSGYGEIDIRGQGSDQSAKNIQILLDGAPITTLVNHPFQTNYNIIPVEQIEKIEVIPGGGSVLYGSGVSGGVVNITTNLKTMEKAVNKIGYEYKDNSEKYYINSGFNLFEKLTLQANYSKNKEDLYFKNTYRNSEYFSGGLNYKISDRQNLSFKYSKFKEDGQYVKNVTKKNLEEQGKEFVPRDVTTTVGVDELGQRIRLTRKAYLFSDREEENFKASYSFIANDKLKILIDTFKNEGYFINNNDDNKRLNQSTLGTKVKADYNYYKNNSVLLGIDYYKQNADLKYDNYTLKKDENGKTVKNHLNQNMYVAEPLTFEYEKSVKAGFFMNKLVLGNFELTQGLRKDITEWEFVKNANDGDGSDKSTRKNEAYEASVAWNYRDTGKIYARYEKGFTGPDGVQISDRVYINGERIYKQTEADDEEFDMFEVGFRDYILGSAINLTAFYTNTDNQLNRVYTWNTDNKLEMKTLNLLKTKRYGVEFTASQVLGRFTFQESYAYLKGKSDYNDFGQKFVEEGNKIDWTQSGLKKVPKHSVVLRTDFDILNNLKLSYVYKYTGGYNNTWKESERS